jgi:hypothetical protein
MLSLSHTLISLPFAFYFKNPILIFTAAFVFHFFCDTLLHWNIYPDNFKKYPAALVAADIIGGLLITYFLIGNQLFTIPVLAAIAGGNAPDVMEGLWSFTPKKIKDNYFTWAKPFFSWHNKLQWETDNFWQGIISQAILISLAIFLILR